MGSWVVGNWVDSWVVGNWVGSWEVGTRILLIVSFNFSEIINRRQIANNY